MGFEQLPHPLVLRTAEDGRVRDLVAVEMQDRQHGAIAHGVQKADALPRAFERPGLGFAIADHCDDEQIGIIEGRAKGVHQHIAKLAALVDRSGRRYADMARHAARRRELAEEPVHPGRVLRDLGVDLRIGAFEIDVGQHGRSAVPRPGQKDGVDILFFDQTVHLDVDQAQAGGGAPVAEQAWLDLLRAQRLAQQRVRLQVDLPDRQVIGRVPVAQEAIEELGRKWSFDRRWGCRLLGGALDRARYRNVKRVHLLLLRG